MGHIFVWRICPSCRRPTYLFTLFFLPAVVLVLKLGQDAFSIVLLHLSLSLAYIQLYPASQADSPSFKILRLVGRAMPRGIDENQISGSFDETELLEARLQDLKEAGLIKEVQGRLAMTQKGNILITPFLCLRRVLGLPQGKG